MWYGWINLAVLCGPFTSTQRALAREKVSVNTRKVQAAFEWLKKHNVLYKDIEIPSENEYQCKIL